MPKAKPLTKEYILAAMNKTKSNRAAARYLNVSYIHYKKWAKFYKDEPTGVSLFEKHKNQSGKGIPKFLNQGKKDPALIDVVEGRVDPEMPLIMHFKDGNKKHYRLENLEMLCYNCYFLTIGDIFTGKQLDGLEDHKPMNSSQVDWEVDDYTTQRLKELGLGDLPDVDDDYDLISRI